MAEVGVAQLRRELKDWLERAHSGDEIVVTDRGRPIARLSGIDVAPLLERLADTGQIGSPPAGSRPRARGRRRVRSDGEVSSLLVADRDAKR